MICTQYVLYRLFSIIKTAETQGASSIMPEKDSSTPSIEENLSLSLRWNAQGLVPCIVTCHENKDVLMMAWMNEEALTKTLETGEAHYWSRSRRALWHKGATSGAVQVVKSMKVDCDQDCLWISVFVESNKNDTCHTGRKTCFYREIAENLETGKACLRFISDN